MICGANNPLGAFLVVSAFVATVGEIHAALPIDLEVAVDPEAPLGAMQAWGRLLGDMDLARLRLRSAQRSDEMAIEAMGTGAAKRYAVTALLNRRNELMLPGGKFRQEQRTQLKTFLQELPARFEEAGIERGPFGLPLALFEELLLDLSTPLSGETKGQPTAEVVAAITSEIKTPVEINTAARSALAKAPPMDADLKGLSSGTALAAALRIAGFALLPRERQGGGLALRVDRLAPDAPSWPVGWKPAESPKIVAPAMYKFTTVEISGFTLAKALDAMAPHLGVPLAYDQRVLADRKLDPAQVQVKYPAEKTYIRRAVDRILSQGRLAGELRVDDAGRPFYWVTQYGPTSPRAPEFPRARAEK
jgi:hypothetical protein